MPIPASTPTSAYNFTQRLSAASSAYYERDPSFNAQNYGDHQSQRYSSSSHGYQREMLRERSVDDEDEKNLKSIPSKKKKKKKSPITMNLSGTRYDIVRAMGENLGFSPGRDEDLNCYLIWNDSFVSTERITELKPYQKINHFPGMGEICRKDCLARNMTKMNKAHPEEFSFVPKTWIFPSEYSAFINYTRELKKKKKNKTFIVKPANGAMGNGIMLYKNAEKIPPNDHMIVQEYIDKPFLVDGYKCDMRIYVLVTNCDPLRLFLYNDGLLRMSTERYLNPQEANVDQLYMHLTNYSVNKHNDNYEKGSSTETGHKRSLKYFNDYLRRNDFDVAFLWKNIMDIIIKTLVVAHPHVLHAYRMCRPGQPVGNDSVCFEILGFDIMLDKKLRPWLLEVNRSPSFSTDERIDFEIKSGVIGDGLRLLNIKASDKRKNMAAQKAEAQKRLLRPTKRSDGDLTEMEKKRLSVEKRKDDLRDMLLRVRKDAAREDFENRNCGCFKRIFPPEDKYRREKYTNLLSEAYTIFLSGRATGLQAEMQKIYNSNLREEDVLDMLAQCEADEKEGRSIPSGKPHRGPKPLQSMPVSRRDANEEDLEDEEEESEEESGQPSSGHWPRSSRPPSVRSGRSYRSAHTAPGWTRSSKNSGSPDELNRELKEETTKQTLLSLNDMRIKFPGKTNDEAEYILDKLHDNWKFHKPRIASYWLVKLDSMKRRKVIDIVRSNVRAVLQRVWKTQEIESLRLYRVFSRVFNRLLWSHGQGLWNCFQSTGSTWETIFSKSTEVISPVEMSCCHRIVQLCRDCLLIVYQFASDAKQTTTANSPGQDQEPAKPRPLSTSDKTTWIPGQIISKRMSRLYNARSQSLNSLNYGML